MGACSIIKWPHPDDDLHVMKLLKGFSVVLYIVSQWYVD